MLSLRKLLLLGLFIVQVAFYLQAAGADEFRLIGSIAATEEYNDNIFLIEDDEPKIDDFITTISPELRLDEKTERLIARLNSRLDFLFYKEVSDLNTVDQFHRGNLQYRLTPRINVAAAADYIVDSRRDRDLERTGLVIPSNAKRNQQRYAVSADYDISEKLTSEIGYTYAKEDYEEEIFADYQSNTVNLLFTHNISDIILQTYSRLNLGYTRYDFSEEFLDFAVDNYFLTIGFEHQFSETFSLIADIGTRYSDDDLELSNDSEEWAPIGEVVLSYRGEFTQISTTIFKLLEPRSGFRTGTVDRTAFIFDVYRRLTEALGVGLAAEYFLNKEGPGTLTVDDHTINIRPRIRYDFTRNVSLEAVYTHSRFNNEVNNLERERNLVFLRFLIQYPFFD